jgi:hypothetical protein
MSMNALYQELEHFLRALGAFNDATNRNWDELQRAWEHADELWQDDATRQRFENDWREMGEALRAYRQEHGEKYEEFLMMRKRALDKYFGKG